MAKICVLFLSVFIAVSGFSSVALASEEGAALLESRCSVCHSSSRPKSKQKTPEQWDKTVTRMMGKGAQLTVDEKKILVDYLSDTYKP